MNICSGLRRTVSHPQNAKTNERFVLATPPCIDFEVPDRSRKSISYYHYGAGGGVITSRYITGRERDDM